MEVVDNRRVLALSAAVAIAAASGACSFDGVPPGGGQADASLADGPTLPDGSTSTGYRKKLTVAPSPLASPLINFSVLVSIDDSDLRANAAMDGGDILFTAADGQTPLAVEIERYRMGNLTAWVLVPSMASNTEMFMYYGSGQVVAREPSAAWPGYGGVWHMSRTGNAGSFFFADSSAAGNHANPDVGANPQILDMIGIVGQSAEFTANSTRVTIGDPIDGSLDFGVDSFTYSVWIDAIGNVGASDMPFYKGGTNTSVPGYNFELGLGPWYASISDASMEYAPTVGMSDEQEPGGFVHLVAVVDRDTEMIRTYRNGMAQGTLALIGSPDFSNTSFATIGSNDNGAFQFSGRIDEIRVRAGAMSATDVATEFDSITNPQSFVTVGPEEFLGN